MSQKTHSLSNKIGIIRTWNLTFSKYGKNFKSYNKFLYNYKYIFKYINCLCQKEHLLLEKINVIKCFNQININLFISSLQNSSIINIKKSLLRTILFWINSSCILSIYKNVNYGSSAFLLNNYINYLFLQKTNSPKKVLQLIYKVVKSQVKITQFKYTIYGIKKLKLKGFKIQISGCFEASRSQMSKVIKCNFGQIPLMKLNGYIDYSSNTFFTKFGSCGLKIWLFYEFN